ncbi:MAG: glycosyltransferase family 4 protein [Gammaproteobacteria bacterium]|nr:glycosyltransferase family 4 protein [Gammaproteobacteria bacterium]
MARVIILGGVSESLINFRKNLLQKLVADGHHVIACAPNATPEVTNKLAEMGVIYQDIHLHRTGLNPFKDLKTLVELIQIFKKNSPDLFLGYTIKPVIYGSIAARIAGIPKIFSMIEGLGYAFTGTGLKRRFFGYIAKALYRSALKHNTKVFFLNPDDMNLFQQQKLVSSPEQQVLLNGIGIDLDEFTPAPVPDRLSFLLIARLVKDKGVFEYVAAAKIIKKSYPGVSFKLVGFFDKNPSSVTKQDLDSWVASGAIEYLGYLRDVHQAIAGCSVYILPSYREGLPRTVLEAMAMARPIITTDAPGCRETVTQGINGLLVPVGDVNALVEAIEHFLQHPEDIERMGQESRRLTVEKYDVHEVNAVILETMGLT